MLCLTRRVSVKLPSRRLLIVLFQRRCRMKQTIPGDMKLNAAVSTFGAGFSSDTTATYGPEPFS
jgi:hypothetical protein